MTDGVTSTKSTNQPAQKQEPASSAPERVTVEVAVGPNVDGLDRMAREAHGAPDPAAADDTGEFAEPAAPAAPATPATPSPTE